MRMFFNTIWPYKYGLIIILLTGSLAVASKALLQEDTDGNYYHPLFYAATCVSALIALCWFVRFAWTIVRGPYGRWTRYKQAVHCCNRLATFGMMTFILMSMNAWLDQNVLGLIFYVSAALVFGALFLRRALLWDIFFRRRSGNPAQ